ncbi:MAG: sigma-70 family RNA polymerase sigma factor [Sandaracinaceae bacterium]|nr:sigma-70 family RNA polymerase sigma factor [Sandaracinaceae bacterium]
MDPSKIDKVVGLLEDDHFRQGGYLDPDQVLQMAERHDLTPEELVAVKTELVTLELLDADEEEPPRARDGAKELPSAESRPPPRWSRADETLLQLYLREVSRIELLTAEDEVRLARRLRVGAGASEALEQAAPDRQRELKALVEDGLRAKQDMVAANVRLVVTIAKRYAGQSLVIDDLVQEGTLGLIRAVERFDPNLGFRFSTYATWWIRQSVTRAIADKDRMIRIPVHAVELLRRVRRTRRALRYEYGGREPSIEELAEQVGRDPTQIQFLLDVARTPASLDEPVGGEGDQTLGDQIRSTFASPEDEALGRETASAILDAIDALPDRERHIIRLRYGLEDGEMHTLEAIGQEFGVTRERIRQIEGKALEQLRRPTSNNPLRELLLARSESEHPQT